MGICDPISKSGLGCGGVPQEVGEIHTDFPASCGWRARQIILHAPSGHEENYQTCAHINLRQTAITQPRCRFVVIREVVEEVVDLEEGRLQVEVVSEEKKFPAQKWARWLMLRYAGRGGFQPQSFGPPAQVLGMFAVVQEEARI